MKYQDRSTNRLNRLLNYDSVAFVTREGHRIVSQKERATQGFALASLLVLGALGVAGPSGLLAWGENLRLLDQRRAQLETLAHDRDELKLHVEALNPNNADPDLVGELLRRDMNVVAPDEVVILLDAPKD